MSQGSCPSVPIMNGPWGTRSIVTPTGSMICGAKNAFVDDEVGVGVNVIVGKEVAVGTSVAVIRGSSSLRS